MEKLSGGLNNWYVVPVKNPQRKEQEPYQAECEDIIQALGMTFDEGCAFKALWRNAAARMGNGKPGNTAVYDAEKMVHYTNRILAKEKSATTESQPAKPSEIWFEPKHQHDVLPGVKIEVEHLSGGYSTLEMQCVDFSRIKRFRYPGGTPIQVVMSSDWIHVKDGAVNIINDRLVEVVSNSGGICTLPMQRIVWSKVKKYRYVSEYSS